MFLLRTQNRQESQRSSSAVGVTFEPRVRFSRVLVPPVPSKLEVTLDHARRYSCFLSKNMNLIPGLKSTHLYTPTGTVKSVKTSASHTTGVVAHFSKVPRVLGWPRFQHGWCLFSLLHFVPARMDITHSS